MPRREAPAANESKAPDALVGKPYAAQELFDVLLAVAREEARRERSRCRWKHTPEDLEQAAERGQLDAWEFAHAHPEAIPDDLAEKCQISVRAYLRTLRVKHEQKTVIASSEDEAIAREEAHEERGGKPTEWPRFSPEADVARRLSEVTVCWAKQFESKFLRMLDDREIAVAFHRAVINDLADCIRSEQGCRPADRLRENADPLAGALIEWSEQTLRLECDVCEPRQRWCECEHTAGVTFFGKGRPSPEQLAMRQIKQAASAWATQLFRLCGIAQEAKRASTKHEHDEIISLAKELADRAQREARARMYRSNEAARRQRKDRA